MPVRARVAQVTVKQDTHVSNWLEVADLDTGPSRVIPVQTTEHDEVVPSGFGWRTEPI